MYGYPYTLLTIWLPRTGIRTTFVDLTAPFALCNAITDETRVVYFDTPVNPALQLIGIVTISSVLDKVNQGRERARRRNP